MKSKSTDVDMTEDDSIAKATNLGSNFETLKTRSGWSETLTCRLFFPLWR
jgi:hypothetical protein